MVGVSIEKNKNQSEQVLASFSESFQWWLDGKQDKIDLATAKCITFLETRRKAGFNDTSKGQGFRNCARLKIDDFDRSFPLTEKTSGSANRNAFFLSNETPYGIIFSI